MRTRGASPGEAPVRGALPPALGSAAPASITHAETWPRIEGTVERDTPRIRPATLRDAKHVVELAESVALQALRLQGTDLAKSGFLVSGYGADVYAEYAQTVEHFLVMHVGSRMVAFLLAYGSEHIDPEKEELNAHIRDTMCPKFVLVKQICTHPRHMGKGYAQCLYKELYGRVLHYYDAEPSPRPIYTVIVSEPPNPRSMSFHSKAGFEQSGTYSPPDGMPRLIFRAQDVRGCLQRMVRPEDHVSCPFYNSLAMADPNCVGVGACFYEVEPPQPSGSFRADVRVMLKWRHPKVEEAYPRVKGAPRTKVDVDGPIRPPRFALNKLDAETVEHYAYIDRDDPRDVVTMQMVLRGHFISTPTNIQDFPADVQHLPLRFRMWDSNPDDRCRYFRQLYYVDGTAWQVCVKRTIRSILCNFLCNQTALGVDPVAETSFLEVSVPCARKTLHYLRVVAIPLAFVSSLAITSIAIPIEDFADRGAQNAALLLTAVAFIFIAAKGVPETEQMTQLDLCTYGSFTVMWAMIMIQFASAMLPLTPLQDQVACTTVFAVLMIFLVVEIVWLAWKYRRTMTSGPELGSY